MKRLIATVCLPGAMDEKLRAIAAAGFKAVEIFENDLIAFDGTPADIRRMAGDLGLTIAVYQPFRDFEGLPEPRRARAFQRAERKFDVMHELGCDFLMICSSVAPESLGGIERAAADLRDLGERAKARGMRIGYEALAWGRHVNDYRDAWEIVRRADHRCVGLVLDSFHVLVRGTALNPMRSIPPEKIFLVQMADAPKLSLDTLSWSRHYRCFPGQGELPIASFMDALGATGFDGLLSLEIFSDRFRAGSARSVAVDGQRSLLVTLDALSRRNKRFVPDLPPMPPRATCRGVEFVEFALDAAEAESFTHTLAGLGFSHVARHRTKDVDHWRQGAVNIVVNREKEGFAHSYSVTHGGSVCAMALKVDDAAATIERAVTILDQPFKQAVAPDELDIPAIRGVAAGLMYFIDDKSELKRLWDVDFEPIAGSGVAGAGIASVDHLAQTLMHEDIQTWQLFYTSLLALDKKPEQSVLDPGGLVQSHVVEAADGALRIVLNASQSRQTLSSRFIQEAFGGGVQHIALACDDIFEAVKFVKDKGVELLPITANYFDDLAARMDLSDAEIARLREGNILYDRDGEDEFFQVYTKTLLEGGFFFEIVQRRGYRGYGSPNAPIRLAAQTRLAPHPGMPRR